MARTRREVRTSSEIWPGFVDALSTMLLVIIFLLVVFVLGQFFLGQVLESRDDDVTRLKAEVTELASRLDQERDRNLDLRRTVTNLSTDLQVRDADVVDFEQQISELESERDIQDEQLVILNEDQQLLQRTLEEMRLEEEVRAQSFADLERELTEARQTLAADKDAIELQLAELIQLRRDIEALRNVRANLEQELEDLTGREQQVRDRNRALESELADAQQQTVLAQREIAEQTIRIETLLRSASDAAQDFDESETERLAVLEQARELMRQVNALRVQLVRLDETLAIKQDEIEEQNITIADLGLRLNEALADRVVELEQFKSEFFGRVRQVLGDQPNVRIVGDRFVFQSELLFGTGSAELGEGGRRELSKLSDTLVRVAGQIPEELPWVLQVDGHTDKRPINTFRFPTNWELSTARAISVAQFFVEQGIPPNRVAARGFAEFQPIDPAETESAYQRNRRIEIKLTTR